MLTIKGLHNVPQISAPCDLPKTLAEIIKKESFKIVNGDIICVASKICSLAEDNIIDLKTIRPTSLAEKIHKQIPRKDAGLIQVIINQTGDPTGKHLEVSGSHIGAWLPNGLFLTSAGVDKGKDNFAITLPKDCDKTAKTISDTFFAILGVRTSVIITDSDGRVDKKGANQVAVGLYGLNGLRLNKENGTAETLCDMLASAAGLVMGQRGMNIPLACIHGLEYEKSDSCKIKDIVN
ncbi:MAG: coenzyme F420-0:L-glutamate ligase [Lactobacillus panisapium]